MKAIITGATKGMGKAISIGFAKEKFDLALSSRSEKELIKFKEELTIQYPGIKVLYKICDLSKKAEVEGFGNFIKSSWINIDVLVNNVGTYLSGSMLEEDESILEKLMDTNFYSAYYLSRNLIEPMIKARKGHIFNICSIASIHPVKGAEAYSLTKEMLLSFTKMLREEVKKYNIKVTAILPSSTYTSSWEGTNIPKEEFIQAEDIASAIINSYRMSVNAVVEEIIIRPLAGEL